MGDNVSISKNTLHWQEVTEFVHNENLAISKDHIEV